MEVSVTLSKKMDIPNIIGNSNYDILRVYTAEDLLTRHFARRFLRIGNNYEAELENKNIEIMSIDDKMIKQKMNALNSNVNDLNNLESDRSNASKLKSGFKILARKNSLLKNVDNSSIRIDKFMRKNLLMWKSKIIKLNEKDKLFEFKKIILKKR